MSIRLALFLILFFSLFFESTIVTFPLVLIFSVLLYILYPDYKTIILGFLCGVILDIIKVSQVGATSTIILLSFLTLSLIKKGFEIKDYKTIILFLFASSFIYSKYFSYTDNLITYSLIFAGAGIFIFYLRKKLLW